MKTIKELKKGNFVLTHKRYIDDMGFEKDIFILEVKNKNGDKINYPFNGIIKVSDYNPSELIKTIIDYTEEEYKQMLNEQIKKYNSYN